MLARKCLSRGTGLREVPGPSSDSGSTVPIVERKRLSRGAVTGGSPAVFGYLAAYGHARGRYMLPRHERAVLRLANPVGGVRPGH